MQATAGDTLSIYNIYRARLFEAAALELKGEDVRAVSLFAIGLLAACDTPGPMESLAEFEGDLRTTYSEKPGAPAYGIFKNNAAGDAWLATVHGYPDNRLTCEQLIAEYNEESELSVFDGTYRCEPITAE